MFRPWRSGAVLPSIADRPDRNLPRLQLGTTNPWSIALGAAAPRRLRSAVLGDLQDAIQRRLKASTATFSPEMSSKGCVRHRHTGFIVRT